MRKFVRVLEVPLYLLVIAMACVEMGHTGIAVFLTVVSVGRLITNVITDDSVYK